MNNFTTGIACGTALGIGIALAMRPISKKEMRKLRYCADRMMHNAGKICRMR